MSEVTVSPSTIIPPEPFDEVVAMVRMGYYPREYALQYPAAPWDAEDLVFEGDHDHLSFHQWVAQNKGNPDLVGRVTIGIIEGAQIGGWVTLIAAV